MKRSTIISILLFLFTFEFVNTYCQSAPERAKVFINEFSSTSKEKQDQELGLAIISSIKLGFLDHSQFEIIINSRSDQIISGSSAPYYVINGDYIISKKEFFIQGNITIYNRSIEINKKSNISNKVFIRPIGGSISRVFEYLNIFSSNLIEKLIEIENQLLESVEEQFKLVGIQSLVQENSSNMGFDTKIITKLLNQLNNELFQNLRGFSGVKYSPFTEMKNYQFNPLRNPNDIIDERNLDALIILKYSISDIDHYFVNAGIQINEDRNQIYSMLSRPYFLGKGYETDNLVKDLNNSLKLIITEEGEWDLRTLSRDRRSNYYVNLFNEYYEGKNYDQAIAIMLKSIEIDPNNPESYFYLAKGLEIKGRKNEALSSYLKSLELDPSYVQANEKVGDLLADLGQPIRAINYYKQALKRNPSQIQIHSKLGKLYFLEEEYPSAIEEFLMITSIDPDSEFLLGLAYEENNEYDRALSIFKRLHHESPESEEISRKLRQVYLRKSQEAYEQGNPSLAVKILTEAKEFVPNKTIYQSMLYGLNILEDFGTSEMLMREGLENEYFDPQIYFDQATELRAIRSDGAYPEKYSRQALKYLLKYLKFRNDVIVNKRIASTYFRLNEYDSAHLYYRLAHELEPEDPGTRLDLAEISLVMGDYAYSLELCRQVLESRLYDAEGNGLKVVALYLISASQIISRKSNSPQEIESIYNILDNDEVSLTWSFANFRDWLQSIELRRKSIDQLIDLSKHIENQTALKRYKK